MCEDDNILLIRKHRDDIVTNLESLIDLLMDETEPRMCDFDMEFITSIEYDVNQIKQMWE